jgi:SAM-dependent methyltransferase
MQVQGHAKAVGAVARYYDARVREFGPTPWGVDWTCELTQKLRFIQLLKIAGRRRRFSLNDLGCGYGALLAFVRERYGREAIDYFGTDVAPMMIDCAAREHANDARAAFAVQATLEHSADFSVASGVFNVQLGFPARAWREWVADTLAQLQRASRVGFAVNFILPPQPGLEPLKGLYRTQPGVWADFCRDALGGKVEVVRDYGLREFTLLVRLSSPRARRAASGRAPSSRTAP